MQRRERPSDESSALTSGGRNPAPVEQGEAPLSSATWALRKTSLPGTANVHHAGDELAAYDAFGYLRCSC